jgi:RNA polymerase sigma factor (sigma-70 family)
MKVMTAETLAVADCVSAGSPSLEGRLATLFDAHHQRLYRLARRLSPNAEDARDLLQDTYLRAAQKLPSVPIGAAAEEAWLVRVLINLCRDRWRRESVRTRANPYEASVTELASGEAAMMARATIWKALQLLSPRRRAVVIMCELEGLAVPAVAEMLGLRSVTVRWHLSRGRRDMERFITQWEGVRRERP